MTVLENLMVAQHNRLMVGLELTRSAASSACRAIATATRAAIEKAIYWLERVDLIDRADDAAADLPYGAPAAARDRPRHVHRPGAPLPRRAGRRPQPARVGRAQRAAPLHLPRAQDLGPADRARHGRGDGDLRPHRRARLRREDLRRHARASCATTRKVIAAYLGVEDEEVEAVEQEVRRDERARSSPSAASRPTTARSSRSAASTSTSTRARSSR